MDKGSLQFISKSATKRTKKYYKAKEQEDFIKRYHKSGLTKQAFCRQHKISSVALSRWISKNKIKNPRGQEAPATKKLTWNRVMPMSPPENKSMLELRLSKSLQMRLPINTDPVWLSQFMRELRECNFD